MTGIAEKRVSVIPKHLRLEWMDALALDPDLPPVGFKVAGVIGRHFNHDSGATFIKQETIARRTGVSLRTVQNAISELERRGYLVVQRRDLGVRASDGRRVAGGKGVANTYLPAFPEDRLADTTSPLKDAMHCVHSRDQRTQNAAPKDAADCVPTQKVFNPERGLASLANTRMRDPADFENWWGAYPHKVGKLAAETAYRNALARASPAELLDGLQRYINAKPPAQQWCAPKTFLNEGRWFDQPAPSPQQQEFLLPIIGGQHANRPSRSAGGPASAHSALAAGYDLIRAAMRSKD